MTDSSTATVLYRDGREVVDLDGVKAKKQDAKEKGLVTRGTFGVILYTVFMEAVHGGLSWSHWEQGGTGPEGVYGFAVREDSSQYDVDFPDPLGTYESKHIKQRTGYRGEIAVDPASGAILRLTVKADLDRSSPLVRADRAGTANSDGGISGSSVLRQPKMAEKRRADEQASAQEPHSGVQGEGGPGRSQG
jgi:hypothetical protein